jgi:hypothetical protein
MPVVSEEKLTIRYFQPSVWREGVGSGIARS